METNISGEKQNPQGNNLQDNKLLFQEFIDAAKAAFQRVWVNRYLWFWGIFLPTSAGMGLNYNFGDWNSGDEHVDGYVEDGFSQVLDFLKEYIFWVALAVAIVIIIQVILWIISAIARSGVIQALNELQTPTKSLTFNFKEVWRAGKKHIVKLLLLDVAIVFAVSVVFLILASPVVLLVFNENVLGAIFVGLVALLIMLPISLLAGYIKQIGTIMIVLSGQKVIRAIEAGCSFVIKNLIPALKLLIVNIVLGIIQGFVSFGVFFVVGIIAVILAVLFGVSLGGYEEVFMNPGENIGKIVTLGSVAGVILLIIFALGLLVKSFFALWQQDIWIWWIKRLGGVEAENGSEAEDKKIKVPKVETAPTINANTNES